MKKTLILISCVFLGSTSCKKNSDIVPTNTITATIDGVDESFNTGTYAQLTTGVATNSNLSVYGTSGGTNPDVISLTLGANQTLTTTSYSSAAVSGSIVYDYESATSGLFANSYATPISGSPSTITITSLTGTSVQGTFSGVLHQRAI
jgi:hypothetical protein